MRIQTDSSACRGCEACQLACSLVHEGLSNPLLARLRVDKDMERYTFQVVLCEQCHLKGEAPACVDACPSDAIRFDERGVVVLLEDLCLRCGACEEACPYHAIFFDAQSGRYFKCDLCAGKDGLACVEICPVGALVLDGGANDGEPQ